MSISGLNFTVISKESEPNKLYFAVRNTLLSTQKYLILLRYESIWVDFVSYRFLNGNLKEGSGFKPESPTTYSCGHMLDTHYYGGVIGYLVHFDKSLFTFLKV